MLCYQPWCQTGLNLSLELNEAGVLAANESNDRGKTRS